MLNVHSYRHIYAYYRNLCNLSVYETFWTFYFIDSCFFYPENPYHPKVIGDAVFLQCVFKQIKLYILGFRAQATMRAQLYGAQRGHSLLKKKSDALTVRFRSILGKIIEVTKSPTLFGILSTFQQFIIRFRFWNLYNYICYWKKKQDKFNSIF